MKTLFLLLLCHFAFAQHDHPSVHGMLVVGKSKVYLSHLPMFHSPHDYQVILEVELDPATQAAYLEARLGSEEKIYTLEPEAFSLSAMVSKPQPFKAKLYQGHFERGGKVLGSGVVYPKAVIYSQKFKRGASQPRMAEYLIFGHADEQFLAHIITAKPDFDQVVQIIPTELKSQVLKVNKLNTNPLVPSETLQTSAGELTVDFEIYFEENELSH